MLNVMVDLGDYNIKYLGENKEMFNKKYDNKFNSNFEMYERIELGGQKNVLVLENMKGSLIRALKIIFLRFSMQ